MSSNIVDNRSIELKKYIASKLLGLTLRFKCDCIIPFDVTGKVVDYSISEGSKEIVFHVDVGGKIIKIGENHPHTTVEAQ